MFVKKVKYYLLLLITISFSYFALQLLESHGLVDNPPLVVSMPVSYTHLPIMKNNYVMSIIDGTVAGVRGSARRAKARKVNFI